MLILEGHAFLLHSPRVWLCPSSWFTSPSPRDGKGSHRWPWARALQACLFKGSPSSLSGLTKFLISLDPGVTLPPTCLEALLVVLRRGKVAPGTQWVEARASAEHTVMHRLLPPQAAIHPDVSVLS